MTTPLRPYDPLKIKEGFIEGLRDTPAYTSLAPRVMESPQLQESLMRSIFPADQIYEDDKGFFVYTIHEPFYSLCHPSLIFQDDRTFLEDWYQACDAYISDLNIREKYILRRYTRHGDEIVNAYLRDPIDFLTNPRIHTLLTEIMPGELKPMFAMQLIDLKDYGNYAEYVSDNDRIQGYQYRELMDMENEYLEETEGETYVHKIIPLLNEFIVDLRLILMNAPPLSKPLQVFRSVKTDYLNSPYEAIQARGFLSTSLDSAIGEYYRYNNYLYQMIIQPGTPCLSIKNASKYYGEFEVLVDMDCYVMPSKLVEKHSLQTDINDPVIAPDHILSSPQNPVRLVRHIQILGGPGHTGGRVATRRTKRVSKASRASRASRAQKGKRLTRRSSKKMKSVGKPKRSLRTSRMPSRSPKVGPWDLRDSLPPRLVKEGIPPAIHARLLEAHKKMGTYF